jgi:hypothetical protein
MGPPALRASREWWQGSVRWRSDLPASHLESWRGINVERGQDPLVLSEPVG